MKVDLRKSDLSLLRFAIETAIGSEEEFISCHTDRHTGRSFDTCVTNKSKRTIARLCRLLKKLRPVAGVAT